MGAGFWNIPEDDIGVGGIISAFFSLSLQVGLLKSNGANGPLGAATTLFGAVGLPTMRGGSVMPCLLALWVRKKYLLQIHLLQMLQRTLIWFGDFRGVVAEVMGPFLTASSGLFHLLVALALTAPTPGGAAGC